jgi:acetyl-CoA C-acetyltransferase
VGFAAASIASGMERFVIGGGSYSSSFMPRMMQRQPGSAEFEQWMPPSHRDRPDAPVFDMSIAVGWNTAKENGLTREQLDAWALRSHQRAVAAIDAGNFVDEIVSIEVLDFDGSTRMFSVDEHPRRDTTAEKLAELKVLHPEIEGFSITAGNASGVNDAAGALMLSSMDAAKGNGSEVIAKILGWTSIGVDPARMGMGGVEVITKLLDRTGRKIRDIKLWEINEAFASVPVAACKVLGLDEDTVNIAGSGCSIGHPIAASGARMLCTLINDLKRAGGGLGVASMCAGGGQGGAVLIEV